MSPPRHRIRRQVLEVIIEDEDAAWRLQSELSRIQGQSLEAIIDRCFTEASDPNRIQRIDSLEVNLGQVDPDNLEHDLIAKLGPVLRQALAERLRQEDEATNLQGEDPEVLSWLELVAFFAHTGRLPWWADASRPRLLDETLGALLQRAARPLVALVRTLAGDRRKLQRLVLHGEDERLSALFGALIRTAAPPALTERSAELGALLLAHAAVAGAAPARFRNAVWRAVLRAACVEQSAVGDAVSFWRGALAHVALELGITYRSLVTVLHDNRESGPVGPPDPLGVVVQRLVREIQGGVLGATIEDKPGQDDSAGDLVPAEEASIHGGHDAAAGDLEELVAILDQLARSPARPLRALFEELRATASRVPARLRGSMLETLRELSPQTLEQGLSAPETASSVVRLLSRVIASRWLAPHVMGRVLGELEQSAAASLPAEILREAQRLLREASEEVPGATHEDKPAGKYSTRDSVESDSAVDGDNAVGSDSAEEALSHDRDDATAGALNELEAILDRLARSSWGPLTALFDELRSMAPRVPARRRGPVLDALRELDQQTLTHGPAAPETASTVVRLLRRAIASRWLPARVLEHVLEELEQAAAATLPVEALAEAQGLLREAIEEAAGASLEEAPGMGPDKPASSRREDKHVPGRSAADIEEDDSDQIDPGQSEPGQEEPSEVRDDSAAGSVEELEAMLDRLARSSWSPLRALFDELRAMARRAPARRRGPVLDALRDLDQQTLKHGPAAPETASSVLRLIRRVIASRWLPTRVLAHILEELEQAAAASLPLEAVQAAQTLLRKTTSEAMHEAADKMPSLNLAYGDSGEAYVENAGLVILWPFLGHLFERLELVADKQLKDAAALHRAVGLVAHLATGDPSPPEYQLPLAKVLCGMPMAEVFDFGPPVTEAEAEECTNLLEAAIANAPILRDMSIDGFRGSFLLRKGLLSARDGAWLLRVERASYDVVLDRFPWGMSWVKLPWMEAPLCVEW